MMAAGTVSGWSAECVDCPYTIEPAFGARVWPGTESENRAAVEAWVRLHVGRFPDHQPAIASFTRWTLTITDQAPASVFALLFGRLPDRPDPIVELRDAVQRVKNIVWQNFGIEPGIPRRALPAGRPAGCIGDGCPHGDRGCFLCPIPRVDDRDWYYLLQFPDGTVAQCAGDWDVAHKHLRAIRAEPIWPAGGPYPVLIGAYPPNAVGGPEGRGGVFSYGYSPSLIGSIDHPREDWIPA